MTKKNWNSLIDHAKTCPPNGKYYVFYRDAERNYGLLFDNFARITGLVQNGVPQAISSASDLEKVCTGLTLSFPFSFYVAR